MVAACCVAFLAAIAPGLPPSLEAATGARPAGAQTPEIEAAQRRADEASQAVSDAESELGVLEQEIVALEAKSQRTTAELEALQSSVQELVVERYMNASDLPLLVADDLNEGLKAEAMTRAVGKGKLDDVDRYAELKADIEADQAALRSRKDAQTAALDRLERALDDVQSELATLQRLEQERREREERERIAAEEAAAKAAAERAAAANRPVTTQAPTRSEPRDTDQPQIVSGGGMVCPVAQPNSFIDSWGYPRSGGRRHQGVDIMAPRGTPVLAPKAGHFDQRSNSLGGLSYRLTTSDGTYFYGAHLDAYSNVGEGHVEAGTVIGYVGNTGNARGGATHLHFEIHPGGGGAVNSYPATRAACG